jgi:hypothetical protein
LTSNLTSKEKGLKHLPSRHAVTGKNEDLRQNKNKTSFHFFSFALLSFYKCNEKRQGTLFVIQGLVCILDTPVNILNIFGKK